MIKFCKKHGETEHSKDSKNYFKCKKCRVENVAKRRKKLRQKARDFFRSKCNMCGYSKSQAALEFHHLNPLEKEFTISSSMSWEKIKTEIQKCVLLCANCHRELHEKLDNSD